MNLNAIRARRALIYERLATDKRVRKYFGPIVRRLRLVEPNILSYVSKILKLESEAKLTDIQDIRRVRSKDIIFVMGCGYSINDVSEEQWRHITNIGDTLSFNYFFKGKFTPINYHLCGEISGAPNYGAVLINRKYRKSIESYYGELFNNPYYKDTIFFLRYKIRAGLITIAIWALSFLKAFKNRRVCLYGIDPHDPFEDIVAEPSDSIYSISHYWATLSDAVNICYILGYKKIVLVGVDLYDRRCFWLRENETSKGDLKAGPSYSNIHKTADKMIKVMGAWNKFLVGKGVSIYIYNPRSLLNTVLPLYGFAGRNVQA